MNREDLKNIVWQKVLNARNNKRPTAKELIKHLVTNFYELHGDRLYGDDSCIISGIGYLDDLKVTIIAQEKGTDTLDKINRNFGMPHPEGYRKALRLMQQAEKFNRPIIFIIDTPGAYPGVGAEQRGQASAIAVNLSTMISLKVPLISIVLGEGGSGGALAIGVSDEVWMYENAIYSILSPEGFASILYKDASQAQEAAVVMRLTAQDLLEFQVIDQILDEDIGLRESYQDSFIKLKEELNQKFKELQSLRTNELIDKRYAKYRSMGKILGG